MQVRERKGERFPLGVLIGLRPVERTIGEDSSLDAPSDDSEVKMQNKIESRCFEQDQPGRMERRMCVVAETPIKDLRNGAITS